MVAGIDLVQEQSKICGFIVPLKCNHFAHTTLTCIIQGDFITVVKTATQFGKDPVAYGLFLCFKVKKHLQEIRRTMLHTPQAMYIQGIYFSIL